MQNLKCLGEAECQAQVGSWIRKRGLGQRYNCGHHGVIEVIKATSVEELTPESGQPAVRRGISLGLALRPSNI